MSEKIINCIEKNIIKNYNNQLFLVENDKRYFLVFNSKLTAKKIKHNFQKWIYYGCKKTIINDSEEYFCEVLEFKTTILIESDFLNIFNIIVSLLNKEENILLIDILDIVNDYFDKINNANYSKYEIQGKFAEILFIKYFQSDHSIDFIDSFQSGDYNMFDFYVDGKYYIEIKSALRSYKNYKITHKQITTNNKNSFLVTINLNIDDNGINILELISKLDYNSYTGSKRMETISNKLKSNKWASELKFDINNFEINFYEMKDVPRLLVNNNDIKNITDIKYTVLLNNIPSITKDVFLNKLNIKKI